MITTLARIRFIADQTKSSFWGSNSEEQKIIDTIREEFKDFLYSPRKNIPNSVYKKMGKLANKLLKNEHRFDDLISMYK